MVVVDVVEWRCSCRGSRRTYDRGSGRCLVDVVVVVVGRPVEGSGGADEVLTVCI